MSMLRLQKRLASSVLRQEVWLDPNKITNARSRQQIWKLIKDGLIIRKPGTVHVHACCCKNTLILSWMSILGCLLRRYCESILDAHVYHSLYLKVKGTLCKNECILMEHKRKAEIARSCWLIRLKHAGPRQRSESFTKRDFRMESIGCQISKKERIACVYSNGITSG
uniref:Large ribosomal subunit protein eL19 n=1 Tax=Leptobrachium leishanense TaxID=445787 RepID=A0A8C5R444_9ANUR